MTDVDALRVALRVGLAIESLGGAYFVGGSLASSMQGEPRATNDVDMVFDLPRGAVDLLVEALGPDFEVDADMVREALAARRTCNIFFLPTVLKIDLFAVGEHPYDEAEFSRRRRVPIPGEDGELWIKSPEDTILRKLLWYREGGEVSERQWRDIVEVLRLNGDRLDSEYLAAWSRRLSLVELLARARAS